MYVTRISRYIYRSVLSVDSRNRGRSWNVLPVDTGALLYLLTGNYRMYLRNLRTFVFLGWPLKNRGA
jgi:hypothetical protein